MTFFTLTLLIRVAASFVCSLAFAVVFRVNTRHLVYTGIAGALIYFVYYTVEFVGAPIFVAAFLSTALAALFSEAYAVIKKAPVIILLAPAVIPIVPGGDLYYSMQRLLSGSWGGAIDALGRTLAIGLGIAGGIVVVSVIFRAIREHRAMLESGRQKNEK